jgi:hypothetical protein
VTDILILDERLAMLSISIAVIVLSGLLLLATGVGHRMAWKHYYRHVQRWATDDVQERNKDLIAQTAELRRTIDERDREIARLERVLSERDARVKAAHVQLGQVMGILG